MNRTVRRDKQVRIVLRIKNCRPM